MISTKTNVTASWTTSTTFCLRKESAFSLLSSAAKNCLSLLKMSTVVVVRAGVMAGVTPAGEIATTKEEEVAEVAVEVKVTKVIAEV